MTNNIESRIRELLSEILTELDGYLVELRVRPGKVEVFADRDPHITIEDCTRISRMLQRELEDEFSFSEQYELEVSSPGMDQPLKIYKQYLRRIGRNVKVIMPDGKLHKGKLLSANDNEFELLETIETKENKKKIKLENNLRLNYNEVKETKLEF